MSEQQHDRSSSAPEPRTGFAGPRLQLPRFQMLGDTPPPPRADAARPAPSAMPAPPSFGGGAAFAARPRPAAQPRAAAPSPSAYAARAPHAPAAPQYYAPAPVTHPQYAPMVNVAPAHAAPMQAAPVHYAPQPHAAPPMAQPPAARQPAMSPAATATLRAATSTSISWERLESPAPATGLLSRVQPLHMGVLMLLVVVVMVVMSGPTAMKTPTPGVVAGGGTAGTVVEGSGIYTPAKAGNAALAAAATGNAPGAAKATPAPATAKAAPATARIAAAPAGGPTMIAIGTAQVPADIRHGGMPSPAAAANLAVRGGGRVSAADTGAVQLNGIPSPTAAAKLGPETLPYKPTDGVTLPRATGERDSHAVDTHYNDATLPMEAPIERPVMTPGESSMRAEHMAAQDDLVGAGYTPAAGATNQAF